MPRTPATKACELTLYGAGLPASFSTLDLNLPYSRLREVDPSLSSLPIVTTEFSDSLSRDRRGIVTSSTEVWLPSELGRR